MLQIQSKRFYLDVKQNARGKFIKVAEVSMLPQPPIILLSIPHELWQILKMFLARECFCSFRLQQTVAGARSSSLFHQPLNFGIISRLSQISTPLLVRFAVFSWLINGSINCGSFLLLLGRRLIDNCCLLYLVGLFSYVWGILLSIERICQVNFCVTPFLSHKAKQHSNNKNCKTT